MKLQTTSRGIFLSVSLCLLLAQLLLPVTGAISPLHATWTPPLYAPPLHPIEALPQNLTPTLAHTLLDKIPSTYDITKAHTGLSASNPAHNINVTFTDTGPTISNNTWHWSMTLTRCGRSQSLIKTPPSTMTATGPRIEYTRGASLTEWYLNTSWGLEQGFTLHTPPTSSSPGDSLILEMTLSGTLTPRLQDTTLLLCDATGETILRYTGLTAVDATGNTLPARLALQGETLRIIVDDTAATYPITIDPWVQKAKLTAGDGAASDHFGYPVSISGDTVVVGAAGDDSDKGSAYVFEKTGNNWIKTAKLTASDGAAGDYFGYSVSISGDTVVVGAVADNTYQGSAYVFEKPLFGGWQDTSTAAKLTASDGAADDKFGRSVAIKGNTVVVGADGDDSYQGSAYIFKLTPSLAPIYMLLLEDDVG